MTRSGLSRSSSRRLARQQHREDGAERVEHGGARLVHQRPELGGVERASERRRCRRRAAPLHARPRRCRGRAASPPGWCRRASMPSASMKCAPLAPVRRWREEHALRRCRSCPTCRAASRRRPAPSRRRRAAYRRSERQRGSRDRRRRDRARRAAQGERSRCDASRRPRPAARRARGCSAAPPRRAPG